MRAWERRDLPALCAQTRELCAAGQDSVVFTDHTAQSSEYGSNQLVVNRKDVMKVLRVELESMHRLKCGNGMHRRVLIESRDDREGLCLTDLANSFAVSFYSDVTHYEKVDRIDEFSFTEDRLTRSEPNIRRQSGDAAKIFDRCMGKEVD